MGAEGKSEYLRHNGVSVTFDFFLIPLHTFTNSRLQQWPQSHGAKCVGLFFLKRKDYIVRINQFSYDYNRNALIDESFDLKLSF